MINKYLNYLILVWIITACVFSSVCVSNEAPEAPKNAETPKELLEKVITATLNADGFYFKGTGFFSFKGPKTDIKIENTFFGMNQKPDLSYITMESKDTGEKIEAYRQGKNAAMRGNKQKEWVRQNFASPKEFIDIYKNNTENIKFDDGVEEKINDTPCRVIEASLNQKGINDFLALYKNVPEGLVNATKSSVIKVWAGKSNNLVYKITVKIDVTIQNELSPAEKDDNENLPPDKKKQPEKTYVKFSGEVACYDYDKPVEIKIPDEVKEIWDGNK
ncbi:MAG: hypothetical protein HY811_05855 [Planctomycetes bacterium]|nr:hypothetical protein [Planctomycetota bacterium]